VEQEDLYKLFSKYGKLREGGEGVALKKNREWFAFVEYEEAESASEAIKK
jgi:RNA recognition motif-containing protein